MPTDAGRPTTSLTGLTLARDYYWEVVAPLLQARWPGVPHAAGRLGSGSEVLGLDDAMSRDHDWGLRLTVLVDRRDPKSVASFLADALPESFRGWPSRFATSWDRQVKARVEIDTSAGFASSRLGLDPTCPWDALDWLSMTGQSLLEVTAGEVFIDTAGGITDIRQRLVWYPGDVWHYVVAADWRRIGQLLPLMGRADLRGDELGSRILATRIASVAMHLAFLLQRRWPPYVKWLGTVFADLPVAEWIGPKLGEVMTGSASSQRQAGSLLLSTGGCKVTVVAGLPRRRCRA